jgi:hypothetical protein
LRRRPRAPRDVTVTTRVSDALMTTLVVDWGQPGWIALGALFVLATAPAVPATRWAMRTRAVVSETAA